MTNAEVRETRQAYVRDAARALEMLATQISMSNDKGTFHIWQEVRNAEATLMYIQKLIDTHHDELEGAMGSATGSPHKGEAK